jgi:sulfite reductase alpha subunit-like flavoprotein
MAVLYGSETGNAEDIAAELGNMARRLHFQTTVDEMDGFKLVRCLRVSAPQHPRGWMVLQMSGISKSQSPSGYLG